MSVPIGSGQTDVFAVSFFLLRRPPLFPPPILPFSFLQTFPHCAFRSLCVSGTESLNLGVAECASRNRNVPEDEFSLNFFFGMIVSGTTVI